MDLRCHIPWLCWELFFLMLCMCCMHKRNSFNLNLTISSNYVLIMLMLMSICVYDPGGYWWLFAYSTWTTTIVSFNFSVSLILAQFTIFDIFRALNFRSCFAALNDIFLAIRFQAISFKSHFQLYSSEISFQRGTFTSNVDSMTKLRPREVGYPSNPNGAHKLLVLHLLRLGFWFFRVFYYCSIIKSPLSLIVTQF